MKVAKYLIAALFVLDVPALFSEFPNVLTKNWWIILVYPPVVSFIFAGICGGFQNYKYKIKEPGAGWNGTKIFFIIALIISATILIKVFFDYK